MIGGKGGQLNIKRGIRGRRGGREAQKVALCRAMATQLSLKNIFNPPFCSGETARHTEEEIQDKGAHL